MVRVNYVQFLAHICWIVHNCRYIYLFHIARSKWWLIDIFLFTYSKQWTTRGRKYNENMLLASKHLRSSWSAVNRLWFACGIKLAYVLLYRPTVLHNTDLRDSKTTLTLEWIWNNIKQHVNSVVCSINSVFVQSRKSCSYILLYALLLVLCGNILEDNKNIWCDANKMIKQPKRRCKPIVNSPLL